MVITAIKTKKFIHQKPGKEIAFGIAGQYIPYEDNIIEYNGKKVLYEIGKVKMEASCCALDDWIYTVVPGYIVNWKGETNEDGLPVTEVEPVTDRQARQDITEIIQVKEDLFVIEFWEGK
jgi:hypothetical protein